MSKELIHIQEVTKHFGKTVAADHVSLSIHEGEFFALLGPSGCGKTTLLRMIAGFETPDSGHILLDGLDLVGMKIWKRPVNMMFQSYALFPHMSIFDNVAYGLRQERVDKTEVNRRVTEVLGMVGLEALAGRRPETLSGGQKQRVALARAIVKRPRVLLLDEPLAALDRKLRVEMRLELKRLQHEVGIAFIFVTHDQEEALTMADRAAVMNEGKVLQVGTPEALYELPRSLFVANFIGESNVITGRLKIEEGQTTLRQLDIIWRVSERSRKDVGVKEGEEAAIILRPEHVRVRSLDDELFDSRRIDSRVGKIVEVAYLGSMRNYLIELDNGERLLAQTQVGKRSERLSLGDRVNVGWDYTRAILVAV